MLSCDTFAIGKKCFESGKNFFAKNSDRPLGEAQPISFFPGGTYAPGATVKCTHLTIPQVSKTYTVLGSRPYWIWGFEMGVNECGLIIGNEAEGSRCDAETVLGKVTILADGICADIQKVGGLYGPKKEFLEAYAQRTNLKF